MLDCILYILKERFKAIAKGISEKVHAELERNEGEQVDDSVAAAIAAARPSFTP